MATLQLTCTKCKISGGPDLFHKNSRAKSGYSTWCKSCSATYHKARTKAGYFKRHYQKNSRGSRDAARTAALKRRAIMHGVNTEEISYPLVYARDDGVCKICGGYVPYSQMSMDHIKPLSRGGEHTYSNVQTAHKSCNSRKGNTYDG